MRLVIGVYQESRRWEWHPEYMGVFSFAQPSSRREVFIQLGFDLLVFPSGWFILALEDYPQALWALEVLECNWIQANEWCTRFLSRPLRFVEPRFLCIVFGNAGYPLYISLNARRRDSHGVPSRYILEFLDDGTVEAKVRYPASLLRRVMIYSFAGGLMHRLL
jgi:hypothetical protein